MTSGVPHGLNQGRTFLVNARAVANGIEQIDPGEPVHNSLKVLEQVDWVIKKAFGTFSLQTEW